MEYTEQQVKELLAKQKAEFKEQIYQLEEKIREVSCKVAIIKNGLH